MSFCTNCSNPLGAGDKFCKNCGASVVECATAYSVPVTPVIVESTPQVYCEPVCSAKSKALGFVGMGLAIGGLVFGVIGLLYTMMGLSFDGAYAFGFAFAFSFFSMPLSIIGGIFCNTSISMGNRSSACSVGSKLRVAGIIVSATMLFLGFIGLMI